MKNFIQNGRMFNYVCPAPVTSGSLIISGALIGVASTDGNTGDNIAVSKAGVFSLPKVTGSAFAQGDSLYWDATAGNLTEVTTANTLVGYAYDAALSADTIANLYVLHSN